MRVLVMGGTQFNGYALVKELVRTGHDVTIVNRGKTEAALLIMDRHWRPDDLSWKDVRGLNVLSIAAWRGRIDVIEALMNPSSKVSSTSPLKFCFLKSP